MKKDSKKLLFERMHTIGGMPIKENYSVDEHEVHPETIKMAASEFPENDESPNYQVKLDNIAKCARELHDIIKDFEELPTWVQDKITIADHNMEAIHDWINTLGHEKDEHGEIIDESR